MKDRMNCAVALVMICMVCFSTSAKMPVYEDIKLLASDGASGDFFGECVASSSDGTAAIVGAYWDDDNGIKSGSAYIYELVSGVWQETKLLASDGAIEDYFGVSVSISSDGTSAIVGAYGYGIDYTPGSAYIYELVSGVWQETKLLASDGVTYDHFARSVSISSDGTSAIVGAYNDDDNGNTSGSAYIFSPSNPLETDCNENGIHDSCELEYPANDQNNNGVLDACECVGDVDSDGNVNVNDLLFIIGYWGSNTTQADLDFNGIVDVADLLILIGNWGPC